ncbi:hypothetical protein KIH79_07615 [Bifidobacterium sp. 82T10]|uniref:Uncharacterized protein n=1 Tax=Bifidobacterium miconis TaxID=2834435 RepID=A0ABS6WHR4_9BIFI|nr:hypothetical protein [Bifidobacterium miconis]MBW3092797.1 hypothetical protein [Bifidobacterium miconis]
MTRIVNYVPRVWRETSQPTDIDWTDGVLTLAHKGSSSETFAQSDSFQVEQSGVYVIAGRCLGVTLPDGGQNTTQNGPLPVWNPQSWAIPLFAPPKTVEVKSYVFEFRVPDTVRELVWRVCAPNGGGAVWDRLFLGLKTDWQALQAQAPSFTSESQRLIL